MHKWRDINCSSFTRELISLLEANFPRTPADFYSKKSSKLKINNIKAHLTSIVVRNPKPIEYHKYWH